MGSAASASNLRMASAVVPLRIWTITSMKLPPGAYLRILNILLQGAWPIKLARVSERAWRRLRAGSGTMHTRSWLACGSRGLDSADHRLGRDDHGKERRKMIQCLSLIHISEPTRLGM